MKKVFLSLALLLVVTLYSNGCKPPSGKITQPDVAVSDNSSQQDELTSRVTYIYNSVFDFYNRWNENGIPENMGESLDTRFCSSDWLHYEDRVRDHDDAIEEGIGFFDADFWVMGQDFQDLSISEVEVKSIEGNKALVDFNLHNCGSVTRVRLEMVKEGSEWKIDNFIDMDADVEGFNWKEGMKAYLIEETGSAE